MTSQADRAHQRAIFKQWEAFCGIPNVSYGADVLGIARLTYRRYRTGEQMLPLTMRLAMSAIARNLKPWGEE